MKTKVIDLCVRGIDFISIFCKKKKLVTHFWKDVLNNWTKVTEITLKKTMKMYGLTPT